MRKHIDPAAELRRILLQAAISADPIVERNEEQKKLRIAKMRAELFDLGFSVVPTVEQEGQK